MYRRVLLLSSAAALIVCAACATPAEPVERAEVARQPIPTANNIAACDSAGASADSTGSCRGPYQPWY